MIIHSFILNQATWPIDSSNTIVSETDYDCMTVVRQLRLTCAGDHQVRNLQLTQQWSSSNSNHPSDTAPASYSPTNIHITCINTFSRNLPQPIFGSAYAFERMSVKSKDICAVLS